MAAELSIIIVNWNAGEFLTRCVDSIVNSGIQTPYDIIIIDNASTDNSLALLESRNRLPQGAKLQIVRNQENVGFGRANNQAFKLTNAPFLFCLNPDTEIKPGAIDTLIKAIQEDSRIGGCGPRLLNPDGSTQTSVYFNPPTAWHTFFWQLGLYSLLPSRIRGEILLGRHWQHNHKRDVPMITGAAFLVRRAVIEKVGGFNEDFHMYAEDNEWCWRIRRSGWRLVFDPAAEVIHRGGVSSTARWSNAEMYRVHLEAGFQFEQLALSRLGLIANQLANVMVVTAQIGIRKIKRVGGLDLSELTLIRNIHREHLRKALSLRRTESTAIKGT